MSQPAAPLDETTRTHMLDAFNVAVARDEVKAPPLMCKYGADEFIPLVREALEAGSEETLARALATPAFWKLYTPAPASAPRPVLVRTDWSAEAKRASKAAFARWREAARACLPAPEAGAAWESTTAQAAAEPAAEGTPAWTWAAALGAGLAVVAKFSWSHRNELRQLLSGGRAGVIKGVTGVVLNSLVGGEAAQQQRVAALPPPEPTGPVPPAAAAAPSAPAEAPHTDPAAVRAWAYQQVDAIDWSQWPMLEGDERLADRFAADKPDLSRSLVAQYLDFHAWVWGRAPNAAEAERVARALTGVWARAAASEGSGPARDVLVKVWLRQVADQLPAHQQEEVRAAFREQLPDGHYTEFGPEAGVPPTGAAGQAGGAALADHMQASDFEAKLTQDMLRNMAGNPSTPPGFKPW